MTQCEQVLLFMTDHGAITSIDAYHMGIMRLSGRIYELRRDGHKIRMTKQQSRQNKNVYYGVYSLEPEVDEG